MKIIVGCKKENVDIDTEDELLELIEKALLDPFNKGKKLNQILDELGIDPMQLTDRRTMQIIENYKFYKNVPSEAFDNDIWFKSVILLQSIEPRLI